MTHALGYIRVSTDEQAGAGSSLATQQEKVEAFCKLHDLILDDVIVDAGESAKSLDRPGVQEILAAVRGRTIGAVVVSKLDRLTRSIRDLGDLLELFEKKGVQLASVSESLDTGSAAGRMVVNILGVLSQWQREAIAERTSEVLQSKMRRGERVSRHAPFGFRHVEVLSPAGDTTWGIEADDHEQAGVVLACELRGRGATLREVSARMAERGFLARSGRPLSPQTVANILARAGDGS